jgi:carbon storage regulator
LFEAEACWRGALKRHAEIRGHMLILTRRPGESLYLGENIKLKVLSIQGKQIKLGLDVPEDMTVYREEVYLKIKEQNSLALEASQQDLLAAASLWQEEAKK